MITNYYVFLYEPGPKWLEGKPVHEQPLAGHFSYMEELESTKKLVLGGGFLDGRGAMGVLQVESIEEANEIIASDPAVVSQVVLARVHPYLVTVAGCIEKTSKG